MFRKITLSIFLLIILKESYAQFSAGYNIGSAGDHITTTDLNNDGYLDVISGSGNRIYWSKNNADNTFEPLASLFVAGGSKIWDVEAGDLDLDGDLDLVVAPNNDHLVFGENLGNETFSGINYVTDSSLNSVRSVVLADLNNDSLLDIVIGKYFGAEVSWFKNLGNLTFSEEQVLYSGSQINDVQIIDFNNDGLKDLFFSSYNGYVFRLKNLGNEQFESEPYELTFFSSLNSFCILDLELDGDLDVVVNSDYDQKIAYRENFGDSSFGSVTYIALDIDGGASFISSEDINCDGLDDMVCFIKNINDVYDGIYWKANNGDKTFTDQNYIHPYATTTSHPFILADIDHSGSIDVIENTFGIKIYNNGNSNCSPVYNEALDFEESMIHFFPNPSDEVVFIELSEHHKISGLQVLNVLGKELNYIAVSENMNVYSISTNNLESGIYILNVLQKEISQNSQQLKLFVKH